jgi:integral membrane protein (TIGR01906 family)
MKTEISGEYNTWKTITSWIITLLTPIVLVLTAVRILLSPVFIEIEYRLPNFPEDPYGFTMEDRLYYANIARLYLLNDADISYLGDLRFPEGEQVPPPSCQYMLDCTRLYNQRELKHMVDVKNLVQVALDIWYASIILLLLLGIWVWYGRHQELYRNALVKGGWLTIFLIGAILLFVVVAFGVAFVLFHQIFFDSGTWSFLYSDTLIRLFPERFWSDIFIVVGVITAGMGLLLVFLIPRVRVKKN